MIVDGQTKLWSLNQTYEESLRLLNETNAAVEMHKHGSCRLDFGHIDAALVSWSFCLFIPVSLG